MSWCKVNLTCNNSEAILIEEILMAHEAISISAVDESGNNPIYEPKVGETPLWKTIKLSALFEETLSKEIINSFLEGISYSNLYIREIDDQNWIEKYQKKFKPIKFGEKLWVVPSWSHGPSIPQIIEVKMDPGMAFGSGSHETTHLCLEYLDENPPNNMSVLDFGCGSGILSISSAVLGADKVIAVDIDPQALTATKENAILNKINNKIEIVSPENISELEVDMIVANIFSNTLIDLKNQFHKYLKKNGILIVSGVLEEQLLQLTLGFQDLFKVVSFKRRNGWCLVEFKRIIHEANINS